MLRIFFNIFTFSLTQLKSYKKENKNGFKITDLLMNIKLYVLTRYPIIVHEQRAKFLPNTENDS